ncbi:PEP-CTERM sorting domain-containing protein [Oceaniferula spumae]
MKSLFTSLCLAASLTSTHGALVSGWSFSQGSPNGSNFGTSSPTIGTGADFSADGVGIFAVTPSYTLANTGDTLTLSGSGTFDFTNADDAASGADAFRMGLFNVNGSANTANWLGVLGTTSHGTTGTGKLFNRLDNLDNSTAEFASGNGTASLDTGVSSNVAPSSGVLRETNFNYDLAIERLGDDSLDVSFTFLNESDGGLTYELNLSGNIAAGDVTTYTFDRVGFLSTGQMDASTVQLNNVDVTFVPEPSSAVLFGLAGLGLLLRRHR